MSTGIGCGISSVFETTVGTSVPGFQNLYSLNFNAASTTEWLRIPNDPVFTPTGPWTASLWYKGSQQLAFLLCKLSSQYDFAITASKITGYARAQFYGGNSNAVSQTLVTNLDITDGNWHHIAVTFDGSQPSGPDNILMYIDGEKYSNAIGNATASSNGVWVSPINKSTELTMATPNQTVGQTMQLDEVSIFSEILDQSTIVSMYNLGTPTDLTLMAGLEGYWRNGDPTGTGAYPTILDESPNSNDGIMIGMNPGDITTDVP